MRLSSTALSLLIATARTSAFGSSSFASRHSRTLSSVVASKSGVPSSDKNNKKRYLAFGSTSVTSLPFTHHDRIMTTRGGSSTALNSAVAADEATAAPVEYFRKDYTPLTNIVTKIRMNFDIRDGKTTVTSKMNVEANPNGPGAGDLVLDGDETCVDLMKLSVDGKDLEEGKDYELSPGKLVIKKSAFGEDGSGLLETTVEIVPEENTQLSGKFDLLKELDEVESVTRR